MLNRNQCRLLCCLLLSTVLNEGLYAIEIPGGPKKVIPLVQCNICTRGITFWPTLYVLIVFSVGLHMLAA